MKTDKSQGKDNNRIKYLFVVALCLLAIAIGIRQATAAYLSISNMKAVASTNENESLFNSNLLYGYLTEPTSIGRNIIEIKNSNDNVSFTISIFNYHKQDINLINPYTVEYDIDIVVSGAKNGDYSGYSVQSSRTSQVKRFDQYKRISFDGETIRGKVAAENQYTVTMPAKDLNYAQFTVVANVKPGSIGTNIYCLAAIITPSIPSEVSTPSVEGRLVESGSINDYAAFNYEVTVGGAESRVKLTWNSNYVEIDPFFAAKHKYVDNNGKPLNTGELEYKADVGTEVIQFYRIKGLSEPSDWDALGLSVSKAK